MPDTSRPNVLFIAIDDLNSCPDEMHGETTVITPNINRLAKRGVLFTNAHCAAPACNPSRASVMTGLAPSTSGMYYNNQDWRVCKRFENVVTLPQHFKLNGYETRGGGKLYHAATLSEALYTGLIDPRPWDEYFPSKDRQMPDEVHPEGWPECRPVNGCKDFYNGYFDWAPLDVDTNEMADAKVVSWAEKHLAVEHEAPLFLGVGIYRPHIPWYTPREYYDRHPLDQIELPEVIEDDLGDIPEAGQAMAKREWHRWIVEQGKWQEAVQAYNASVSFCDDMIGRLLDALDNGPLADNTIVILWSDHGYHLGQKEHWEKFSLWEQTTRVPLIVAPPRGFVSGETCAQPVSLLDMYPTLVDLSGTTPNAEFDGKSLAPLLRDPKRETGRAVVCTHGFGNHVVRTDQWRYTRYKDGSEELYDHVNDSQEFHNLANDASYDSIKQEMISRLPQRDATVDPKERWRQRGRKEKGV